MKHLNEAKSLDEAIRLLKYKDLRIGHGFIGPKGRIELRRVSCVQGTCYRAEVLVSDLQSKGRILTLSWNRKEKIWDPDRKKTQSIIDKWKDLW